ncbi:hypothetical protein Y1Q_0010011 [Alligator mississippiensis]|uniref:Uncharacterized protein n=1 Tax=Alligator mississippiensis TaxID=8496 RepID=A0A151ML64_ALLMI|nr:hypothetical protein Y1Q_0010011 [Alligator mississippiensis]
MKELEGQCFIDLSSAPGWVSPGTEDTLGTCEGIVSKQGKNQLLQIRVPTKVLRSKGKVDPDMLQHRVCQAVDQAFEYSALTSNYMHFAQALLAQGTLPREQ